MRLARPLGLRGSSPLARGLHQTATSSNTAPRIIPARAGFTNTGTSSSRASSDHPRSRGVYSASMSMTPVVPGSSPLARGLRCEGRSVAESGRIIPARAGFTTAGPSGEARSAGSSPLARGLRGACAPRGVLGGIIPARAGFTPRQYHPVAARPDHPRSRGVYPALEAVQFWVSGSSPLARGLHRREVRTVHQLGIIPARAGFTTSSTRRSSARWDHPRSRGVYLSVADSALVPAGSSPLARGLLDAINEISSLIRIIPARAGFTPR